VPADTYDERTLGLLRALVALDGHGIQPRHVRGTRQAAEREVALVGSALAPLLRRTDAASRARANELAPELVRRLDEVRAAFSGRRSTARAVSTATRRIGMRMSLPVGESSSTVEGHTGPAGGDDDRA
jgi:hypothetical protein